MGVKSGLEALDDRLRRGSEDVVMRNLAPLLRLDPFRSQAVEPAPLFELHTEPDHMKKGLLTRKTADGRAVIRVEVAVHRDPARLSERDRLLYLAALKVLFVQSGPIVHRCRR